MSERSCPFNKGRYPFEGGDGCRADCALLMPVEVGEKPAKMCAIALIAWELVRRAR